MSLCVITIISSFRICSCPRVLGNIPRVQFSGAACKQKIALNLYSGRFLGVKYGVGRRQAPVRTRSDVQQELSERARRLENTLFTALDSDIEISLFSSALRSVLTRA